MVSSPYLLIFAQVALDCWSMLKTAALPLLLAYKVCRAPLLIHAWNVSYISVNFRLRYFIFCKTLGVGSR
jgi:hypothetical protein